eukprot:scaffold172901_cov26-Tisochrysis_lutea.AAC.2
MRSCEYLWRIILYGQKELEESAPLAWGLLGERSPAVTSAEAACSTCPTRISWATSASEPTGGGRPSASASLSCSWRARSSRAGSGSVVSVG